MGEWKATMEFVCDLIAERKLERKDMLWLTYLLGVQDQVPDEGTDAQLREKIMRTRAFVGWALQHECYPRSVLQQAREACTPDDAPLCECCGMRKAGMVRIDPKTHRHLGDYLCHYCVQEEIKPARFEGGYWTHLPWHLPESEEAGGRALDAIMDRKYRRGG